MSNKPTVDGIPCNPQRTNQNGIYHVYFDRKDATGIAEILEALADPDTRAAEARRSFAAARAFDSQALDRARKEFYQAFLHDDQENPCPD